MCGKIGHEKKITNCSSFDLYLRQILDNQRIQPLFLLQLLLKFLLQLIKPPLEIKIILVIGQPHISARSQHIIQFPHPFDGGGVAEALYILIIAVRISPVVIGGGDRSNIFRTEFLCPAVDQVAQVAGINKEDLIGAVE